MKISSKVLTVVAAAIVMGPCLTCLPVQQPPSYPPRGPTANPPNAPTIGPASCKAGEDWCQGECRDSSDYLNDSMNCGRCGNQCGFGETCNGGSCSCAVGYQSCMGQCVNDATFMTDDNNCGSCGHSCSIGESCTGGFCQKRP